MVADDRDREQALLLEVAVEAVRVAGRIALEGFRGRLDIRSKGGKDIVTQYDTAAEEAALQVIRSHYPSHSILGEEGGASNHSADAESSYNWAVDPIDGTHNYAMQLPFWCCSVGVLDDTRRPVAGAIFDPLHDELFTARLGAGAYLNGRAITVSTTQELENARVVSDVGYEPDVARRMLALAGWVQPRVLRLRILGSAILGLAYVAAGRVDAYYHLTLQPWDIAASSLLVGEAGGTVTDWDGQPLIVGKTSVVAANPVLQPKLLQLLHEGDPGRK